MNIFKYRLLLLNNYKFIRILKWLISFLFLYVIRIEQCFCKKRAGRKKRLFSTTGNISLLNALTIIEQLGDEDCEDYLIIESASGGYNFWKNNFEISKLHKFKCVKYFYNIKYKTGLRFAKWSYFDEIYMLNHESSLPAILELYSSSDINLFDEGCGSLVMHSEKIKNIRNLKKFYTHRYINKIDSFGLPRFITDKIIPLDTDAFRKIARKISEKFPITTLYNHGDKNILFCGIYWQMSGLDEETLIKEQNKQIGELIEAGYKVLFKPHPRQTKFYGMDKNPNVIFVNSVLSVEIYEWDVLAVTGMNCSTLIHLPHYQKIPAFSNISKAAISNLNSIPADNIVKKFIEEYTPNYRELIKLDVINTDRDVLKEQIRKMYEDFLKDKPLLSENENIKEYARQYGM